MRLVKICLIRCDWLALSEKQYGPSLFKTPHDKNKTCIPDKKETHHVELINSQKDYKRWTSFVYIGSKVCQLLLHYTSFATRGLNVLKNRGIKHDFPLINIRKVPRKVLKTEGEARGFQPSRGTLRMFMNEKIMFDRYYCINSTKHCENENIGALYFITSPHFPTRVHYARFGPRSSTHNSARALRDAW